MMTKNKSKTKEQILAEKREAERKRYRKIKDDPVKYKEQKEKERLKYQRKKEKKLVKPIAEMTLREKRAKRKYWKKNSKNYRENKKRNETINLYNHSPPVLDNENECNQLNLETEVSLQQEVLRLRKEVRKQKLLTTRNRKRYYLAMKKKDNIICKLNKNAERYKKRYNRLKATKEVSAGSAHSKVKKILLDSGMSNSPEIAKNLLFGKVSH